MKIVILAALIAVAAVGPAQAEVVDRSADGFTLRFASDVSAAPEAVIRAVGDLPMWWDPAHTYSGNGANLSLAFQPGGCWCEKLADGTTFEHARVAAIEPGRVTMIAPLGPLHGKATRSDLTISTEAHTEGGRVVMEFVVEGPGLGALADPVNGVMNGGFARFVAHAEGGAAIKPAD